jgi:hypothetical protein
MKYSEPTSKKAYLFDKSRVDREIIGTIDVYTEQGISTVVVSLNGMRPSQQIMSEKIVESSIAAFLKKHNFSIVWERQKQRCAYLFDNNGVEKEEIGTIKIDTEKGVSTLSIKIVGKKPVTQMMSDSEVSPMIEKFTKKYNLSIVWDKPAEMKKVGELTSLTSLTLSFKSKIESLRKALFLRK